MNRGTIKKLVSERVRLHRRPDGTDYFFHRSGVEEFDSLRGGEKVTFEVEQSQKGLGQLESA